MIAHKNFSLGNARCRCIHRKAFAQNRLTIEVPTLTDLIDLLSFVIYVRRNIRYTNTNLDAK